MPPAQPRPAAPLRGGPPSLAGIGVSGRPRLTAAALKSPFFFGGLPPAFGASRGAPSTQGQALRGLRRLALRACAPRGSQGVRFGPAEKMRGGAKARTKASIIGGSISRLVGRVRRWV